MSAQCPAYISARSAEVILSDVRPIKLKPEALHSVNVLLDEVLYNILTTARSIAIDKLKPALLRVLPSSLGKEALLEAEVELKAYWDRTGSARIPTQSRDGSTFDLQWSFEVRTPLFYHFAAYMHHTNDGADASYALQLLRLKCEAYSTMNDTDEDAEAERRLQQRMEGAGSATPPSPALLAPAALYLTAILEYVCPHLSRASFGNSHRRCGAQGDMRVRLTCLLSFTTPSRAYFFLSPVAAREHSHILSNVSRVASRDSSRTLATVQDLFIALGEDDAIYSMFKSMKGA